MKTALVLGAGGFIGSHMVKRLKKDGFWVKGVDLKKPEYSTSAADEFIIADLRDAKKVKELISHNGKPYDHIYQFAADMGGAGFIFTGTNDADIMHNSSTINLNVLDALHKLNTQLGVNQTRIFYSSSACIYPAYNQEDPHNPKCSEDSAYPAAPDSEYGWEKLFSERLYFSFHKNYKIPVRVARYHNIFGPEGTWDGGREKAPAAMCRKVAYSNGEIEIWGDGKQTRSFLYIDDCIEATRRLIESDFIGPVNVGSEEMVTINQLADIVAKIAGKNIKKKHIDGPLGVRGRNSDNQLIKDRLKWAPNISLETGLSKTYPWIVSQIELKKTK